MAQLEYVGSKPRKEDNITHSGVIWYGPGDVQEVPDASMHKLLAHVDVWRRPAPVGGLATLAAAASPELLGETNSASAKQEAEAPAAQPTAAAPAAPSAPRFVLDGPDGPLVLDELDDKALHALSDRLAAETDGAIKKVDGRLKGDKARTAILDAVKSARTEG